MKKLYIIVTYTGTILSKIIRIVKRDEFSHVSIALDEELEEMYSFGRLKPYNTFIGGFVHEHLDRGTFKRFHKTVAEIYSIEVTEEQYEKSKKVITYFKNNKEKYKFNLLGLACVNINKRIVRKNTFYCAEFVRHILKYAGKKEVNELQEIIRPEDFRKLKGTKLEYKGLLREYKR